MRVTTIEIENKRVRIGKQVNNNNKKKKKRKLNTTEDSSKRTNKTNYTQLLVDIKQNMKCTRKLNESNSYYGNGVRQTIGETHEIYDLPMYACV